VITFLLISKFGIQYLFFSTEAIVQTYFDKSMLKRHTTTKEKAETKDGFGYQERWLPESHGRRMIYMSESLHG
jgi:hypothetical protein